MTTMTIIQSARAAADSAAQPYRNTGAHEDFVIATVRYGNGQTEYFSGPERFAEAKAQAFCKVLKQNGIQASWSSRLD